MNYSMVQLVWLFFVYAFLGWILETAFCVYKHKKFLNRGIISGPLSLIYGIVAVWITVGLSELNGFWLFVFSALYATIAEWVAGHILEKITKKRFWDYSNIKWNLDGYICFPVSVLWGFLGFVSKTWGNKLFLVVPKYIPSIIFNIAIWVLSVLLVIDLVTTFVFLSGRSNSKMPKSLEKANKEMAGLTVRLQKWLTDKIEQRMQKAYPKAIKIETCDESKEADQQVFAKGCSFYKIFLLFVAAAFLGDIVETIFCRLTAGVWMSRSSLVWGPFSVVWGLAIAVFTALLYKYKDRSDRFLFILGMLLGGAYEYLCSVFTEIVFGKVFWDYSHMPLNLGGRINLLYCFFWGFAAVAWFKGVFPKISAAIEKIPMLFGKIMTWCLIVFMCANVIMSMAALIRFDERDKAIPAQNQVQEWLDLHYNDEKMMKIYPNASSR